MGLVPVGAALQRAAPICQCAMAGARWASSTLLLRLDGEPWHMEVACKYYLVVGRRRRGGGPDLHDAWLRKFAAGAAVAPEPASAGTGCVAPLAGRIAGWVCAARTIFSP